MNPDHLEKVRSGAGFFAALDQSGGSTPKALAEYGVTADRWSDETGMFDLVHAMRTRVITSPAFTGDSILGAILFEQTLDRAIDGVPSAAYLWDRRGVVPFLKVDKGLADEADGVQLMKPIGGLDELLARATANGVFGTKMRSVIKDADPAGITAIVEQQYAYAATIAAAGLVPILEPEVSIDSPHRDEAEALLAAALADGLPAQGTVMLKLTIPTRPDRYATLAEDPRVLRVLALSGGYSRDEACERLARTPGMIASFSRALLEGLSDGQSDEQFDATLAASITQIRAASVEKKV